LKGVNCALLVLLQPGRHVHNTEGIKRRAGVVGGVWWGGKHIEFVVAVYLVLSVFIPHTSTERHSAYSVCRPAMPVQFLKTPSSDLDP